MIPAAGSTSKKKCLGLKDINEYEWFKTDPLIQTAIGKDLILKRDEEYMSGVY